MQTDSLRRALLILGWVGAVASVLVALVGRLWLGHWDEEGGSDALVWYLSLLGGALALLIGLWLLSAAPLTATILVIAGAVAAGLAIFGTVIGPIFAGVLVVLAVLYMLHRAAGRSDRSRIA